ncbi:MAG: two-component system, chemotaxis family, protein-glutamate methylesterase/glutaminase [Chthoniobacter sp.]|jgi:two-component system chemotaxis response regulator CheB|nr:two-component system, chemotaxis family, protein-glutamate methylesterase/glutaminase [Chthoniobacter sp.]
MTSDGKITVMVVEDSMVARQLLVHILTSDPLIQVVACARTGEEAIALLKSRKPDVVTMDIVMPKMDGFETTRQIMETNPLPIVIVSATYNPDDVALTFRAIEAGAVAAVEKPPGMADPTFESRAKKLVEMVKAMSEVRVVRRWPRVRPPLPPPPVAGERSAAKIKLVAIGASTGGPMVLQTILAALPKPFPVPVAIVQHISAGFVQGLADWLTQTTAVRVTVARDGEIVQPGTVYLAPDECQMRIDRGGRIACVPQEAENGLRPSVSFLFRSVALHYGDSAVGILLTGMGRDGAIELKEMRDRGAVTIAQDKESSVVHGMPGEAIKCGGALYVLPPEAIAETLGALLARRANAVEPRS